MDSLLEDRLWESLFTGAQQALRAGQVNDALRDFEAAVKLAEEFEPGDSRLVKSLTGLGLTYSIMKQFNLAEKPLERALTLTTKFRGLFHSESLGLLKNLAVVATNLGKFEHAEKYYAQAISMYEKTQPGHPDIKVLFEQRALLAPKIDKTVIIKQPPPPAAKTDIRSAARAKAKPAPTTSLINKLQPPAAAKTKTNITQQPLPIASHSADPIQAAGHKQQAPLPLYTTQTQIAAQPKISSNQQPQSPAAYSTNSHQAADHKLQAPLPHQSSQPAKPSLDPSTLAGSFIDNRYQVFEKIAEGGMSAVYRAKHLYMNRPVAIKILHTHLTVSEKVRERFKQEARTVGLLQHPNIVSVHDFGEVQGCLYLVMDLVDGISLSGLVQKLGRIPSRRCFHILMQICEGLQHAHETGILHRDLKPGNIMIIENSDSEDIVRIVDFGIAKFLEKGEEHLQLTQTGETVGSPLYMSPEQCRGEKLDTRSDIYSLGCLAYKALAGVPPFTGNNQIDVYIKHTQQPPPSFNSVCPAAFIPDQLEKIIMKALEKTPAQRFSSMVEFQEALKAFALSQNWTP